MPIINFAKEYGEEECYRCGVIFYISLQLKHSLKETKNIFYCPNGDSQRYSKSTSDLLKENLANRDARIMALETQKNELERQLTELERKDKKKNKSTPKTR